MHFLRIVSRTGLSLAAAFVVASLARAQAPTTPAPANPATPAAEAAEPASTAPTFTPAQQQARQAVLNSPEWQEARRKFETWLGVQSTYDAEQVETMKREFAARFAAMNADELKTYLGYMQRQLDVLLLPEVAQARNWADKFYTHEGKLELLKEYGMSDPVSMTAAEMVAALNKFAADRKELPAAQAAFLKGLSAQAAANAERDRAAQQAAAAAGRQAARSTSPYAPAKVRNQGVAARYSSPYPMPYSIGPWGGVWYGF